MKQDVFKHFDTDYIDFWALLNISFGVTPEEVDNAYLSACDSKLTNKMKVDEYFVAWKLLRDKSYEFTYSKLKSLQSTYDAGFFLDTLNIEQTSQFSIDSNYISVPMNKLGTAIKGAKNIVLVSTGGYSPIHDGHLNILEVTKDKLSDQGWNVLGGYISPSHDYYVDTKDNGKAANPATNRIRLCQEKVQSNDWLMVSPLESLYRPTAVNFTDVINDLETYLSNHIQGNFVIGYVFGGDNAEFIKSFNKEHKNLAICVTRNHKNEVDIHDDRFNYIYIEENELHHLSSTQIRQQSKTRINDIQSFEYLVRDDFSHWNLNGLNPLYKTMALLQEQFPEHNIQTIDVEKQIKLAKKDRETIELPSISLDLYLKGDFNVNVSREFDLADAQIKAKHLITRPESNSTYEQEINAIPEGEYLLLEDDIASGRTLKLLKSLLGDKKQLSEQIILADYQDQDANYDDIVDLRDFFLNVEFGGLVTNFKGQNLRVPYWYPFVDLTSRASINPQNTIEFTRKIVELNVEFYQEMKDNNQEVEINVQTQRLLKALNFTFENNPIDTLINFCQWNIDNLPQI